MINVNKSPGIGLQFGLEKTKLFVKATFCIIRRLLPFQKLGDNRYGKVRNLKNFRNIICNCLKHSRAKQFPDRRTCRLFNVNQKLS